MAERADRYGAGVDRAGVRARPDKSPRVIFAKTSVSITHVQIGFGKGDGARREASGKWSNDASSDGTTYVRADIADGLRRALLRIRGNPDDCSHSGDGHARCREIADEALSALSKPTLPTPEPSHD